MSGEDIHLLTRSPKDGLEGFASVINLSLNKGKSNLPARPGQFEADELVETMGAYLGPVPLHLF